MCYNFPEKFTNEPSVLLSRTTHSLFDSQRVQNSKPQLNYYINGNNEEDLLGDASPTFHC